MTLLPLIVNQTAGAGRAGRLAPQVVDQFAERGVTADLYLPRSTGETQLLFQDLRSSGSERVVVVGGDGMVHLACDSFAGSATIVGIIPGGTGNDGAAGLGLPLELGPAVVAALEPPVAVDVIACGDHRALSVATLGFSVDVNARADAMAFPKGSSRYTLATLIELPRLRSHRLNIVIDGEVHSCEPNLLAVANTTSFGGGMKIAPSADPTDGMLDVVVMGPAPKSAFVRLLPTIFSGAHIKDRRVTVYSGATIELDGPPLEVRADGEVLGNLPLTLSVMPGSLRVAGARPSL